MLMCSNLREFASSLFNTFAHSLKAYCHAVSVIEQSKANDRSLLKISLYEVQLNMKPYDSNCLGKRTLIEAEF